MKDEVKEYTATECSDKERAMAAERLRSLDLSVCADSNERLSAICRAVVRPEFGWTLGTCDMLRLWLARLLDTKGDDGACRCGHELVPKVSAPSDTSDGYHTFQELYDHRTALLAFAATIYTLLVGTAGQEHATCAAFRSRMHDDGSMYEGMFIVGINCSTSADEDLWATWHCEDRWWDAFALVPELYRAPKFDGHTPQDALARITDALGFMKRALT